MCLSILRDKIKEFSLSASLLGVPFSLGFQVDVLKENLRKADDEISELDSIIEQVRSVMHREIGVVKHSPALLELIRELDGVEAPPTY